MAVVFVMRGSGVRLSPPAPLNQYDSDGNRVQLNDGSTTTTYIYNSANNRLLTESDNQLAYQYDQTGNTTFDGHHSYLYDATNRLTGFDGFNTAYVYNALGQRVVKPDTLLPGDANGDGVVDQSDLTLLQNALSGQIAFTPGMDCNQDGVVDQTDVQCVENIITPAAAPSLSKSISPDTICIGCGGGNTPPISNPGSVTTSVVSQRLE